MSQYALLDPFCYFPLPASFNWNEYIEAERELWALFPETDGRRVNFVQIGLTAEIFAQVPNDGSELLPDETYILMPCPDRTLRPIRMEACRRLTLSEYRMGHLTAIKLMGKMSEAADVMREVGACILGDEVMEEVEARLRDEEEDE
ncbi:MAG: hypothetical protein JSU00_03510 [Acidobacteria bacterium]|nr:hypothetical protein [Acidobacteriota bacterium]